jgi:hypothetical protein
MTPRPFTTLADEMLSDLGGYINRLSADTCPDLKARLRANVADTVRKRGPVHEGRQTQIKECRLLDQTLVARQLDANPPPFPDWTWTAEAFARYFDCSPEDIDCDDDNLISVKGEIVGFVRTRIG